MQHRGVSHKVSHLVTGIGFSPAIAGFWLKSLVQGRKYKEENFPSCHEVSDTLLLQISNLKPQTLGRTQLAQMYFPNIQPMSAWLKLKSLLSENPDLAPLSQLKRRSFLPAEVAKIYESLGHP